MNFGMPGVSVVLPIYGDFDSRRLEASIASISVQKGVDLEIIVAEQNESSKLDPKIASSIVHVFSDQSILPRSQHYSPGGIRNLGLRAASKEFLYTNDADIVFLNDRFLANLVVHVCVDPRLALMRPLMRRLPLAEFEKFYSIIRASGIARAIASLQRSEPYLCTVSRRSYNFKKVSGRRQHADQIFTVPLDDFERYKSGEEFQGEEPRIFLENLHRGGNFLRTQQIIEIGGYHEMYRKWGCEDSDLQWKVEELFRLETIPEEEGFEVLHLDHPKGYFDRELWMANEEILKQRQAEGIVKAVQFDNSIWEGVH